MNGWMIGSIALPIVLALLWRVLRVRGKALNALTMLTVCLSALLAAGAAVWGVGAEISLRWTDMLALTLRIDGVSRLAR